METLCPNESQLLEKVQVYYPGKGRDQIASFMAILIKCAFFGFSSYHNNAFFARTFRK